jgi:hypothetical protein
MPEVSVYKNSNSRFDKYQVWTARQGVLMDSIAQTAGMSKSPNNEFGLRILAPNPRHRVAALLWGQVVSHWRSLIGKTCCPEDRSGPG